MTHPIRMLRFLLVLAFLLAPLSMPASGTEIPWQEKVDPWVLETSAGEQTEYLVFLAEQADLRAAATLGTKLEKGAYVFSRLTETARRTQGPVLAALQARGVEYRPYWVANMIWVRSGIDTIQALAQRPDIAHLYANPAVRLDLPDPGPSGPEAVDAIEWNILKVNADDVWAAGYTGQGAVVAGQDTGYDWDHPALKNQYRGWNGSTADHNYNWHDAIHSGGGVCGPNSPEPCDDHYHGTHTMGTMIGDDGGSNQIGMAPGARWIGCRNMNQGVGTPATYSECYQWFIAPTDLNGQNPRPDLAPDVINNSWGCPESEGCTDPNVLLTVVNNVRAAGILTAHSAGNSGPACSSITDPAAIYDASFTVGNTTSTDAISSSSSRGPVTVDGSGRLKPDISAPGTSIRSSLPNGTYGSLSGTSMAAPHVAGLTALLISANPAMAGNVDGLEDAMRNSAVPLSNTQTCGSIPSGQVPNNVFGYGRIDALAAVASLALHDLDITKTAVPAMVEPGGLITYTLQFTHTHLTSPATNVLVQDTIPEGTAFESASAGYTSDGQTVRWDYASIPANDTIKEQLVVRVNADSTGWIVNDQYSVASDEVSAVSGPPVSTPVIAHGLAVNKVAPVRVIAGEKLTYSLQVTNLHPLEPATQVVLTDTLPMDTEFVSATAPYSRSGDTFRWDFPSLAAAETASVQLTVRVPMTGTTSITNRYYGARSAEVPEGVAGAPVTTHILLRVHGLELSKTGPPAVSAGAEITYTLRVTNTHPLALAHQILVTDSLPSGTSFITATLPHTLAGGVVSWEIDQLEGYTGQDLQLVVQTDPSATGPVVNGAYAATSQEVETPASGPPVITELLVPSAALSAGGEFAGLPGSPIAFSHTLTNTGTMTGNFVISAESEHGWPVDPPVLTMTLSPDEKFRFTITANIPADGLAGVGDIVHISVTPENSPLVIAEAWDRIEVLQGYFLPFIPFARP